MMSALIGVLLLSVNERVMSANEASVNELMRQSVITCHIIANDPMESPVRIMPMDVEELIHRDEVADYFAYERGPFYMNGAGAASDFHVVYSTTDYAHFFRETYVDYEIDPAYSETDFSSENYVCFAARSFLSARNVEIGDTIEIRGGRADTSYDPDAPLLSFRIIGSFDSDFTSISSCAILVPEPCFFTRGAQRITYNSETYLQWYRFHFFSFTLKPEYNGTFEETVADLMPVVEKIGDYSIHVDAKEMETTLRPMELRLAIQRRLTGVLRVIFMLLSMIAAALMGRAERGEILIRRLFGDGPSVIVTETAFAGLGVMAAMLVPALALVFLMASPSMTGYFAVVLSASFLTFCIMLIWGAAEPIIPMYQSLNKDI